MLAHDSSHKNASLFGRYVRETAKKTRMTPMHTSMAVRSMLCMTIDNIVVSIDYGPPEIGDFPIQGTTGSWAWLPGNPKAMYSTGLFMVVGHFPLFEHY